MKIKLFFSGRAKKNGDLISFCSEKGITLTDTALIRFVKLPFSVNQTFDVVFFTSPRSVEYFFSENYEDSSFVSACIGKGTAEALSIRNITPEFIGKKSGDPKSVAKDFLHWLGKRTVLFPVSTKSLGSISKDVPEDQKIILPIYETIPCPEKLPPQDIYVFTSPSNVDAFLMANELPEQCRVVAWGSSTAEKIAASGLPCHAVLEHSSEEALVEVLKKM